MLVLTEKFFLMYWDAAPGTRGGLEAPPLGLFFEAGAAAVELGSVLDCAGVDAAGGI